MLIRIRNREKKEEALEAEKKTLNVIDNDCCRCPNPGGTLKCFLL